jgi:HPt (histidine-containing phosphotransfer) domain-containing protein
LRITYIRSAQDKLATLDKLWQQATAGNLSPEALAPLREFSHRLAGSGGSYGFPALGDAAHELEMLLANAEPASPGERMLRRLRDRLKTELEALATQAP